MASTHDTARLIARRPERKLASLEPNVSAMSEVMADLGDIGLELLQRNVLGEVFLDIAALGGSGTLEMLERAQDLCFRGILEAGGFLLFPHVWSRDCGYQTAACVQACLDSGSDTVVVLGVLHPLNADLAAAVARVAAGGDPAAEGRRGIQGPDLAAPEDWRRDHSLLQWRHFWDSEIKRRGLARARVPRVIERYPFLAGGQPATLPGIDDLGELIGDGVVVATGDLFHHGVAYGLPAAEAVERQDGGRELARRVISEGLGILERGDYAAYEGHCESAQSDAADVLEALHFLRQPGPWRLVDVTCSDMSRLYGTGPSWVAGALIEWAAAG